MDSTKKEYPVVYVYMLESIDGKASGEVLNAPASLFGKNYYFSHQYSYGSKSILLGRSTFEIFLGLDKSRTYRLYRNNNWKNRKQRLFIWK